MPIPADFCMFTKPDPEQLLTGICAKDTLLSHFSPYLHPSLQIESHCNPHKTTVILSLPPYGFLA
jgi:hypothetical protein